MKLCRTCNETKDITEFHVQKSGSQGVYSVCKSCRSLNRSVLKEMLRNARRRAKKKGLEFGIDEKYIRKLNQKQNGCCAITGIKLNWDSTDRKRQRVCPIDRASLDRIDSSGGYTEDNLQLVTDFMNRLKREHGVSDLLSFCKTVIKNLGHICAID